MFYLKLLSFLMLVGLACTVSIVYPILSPPEDVVGPSDAIFVLAGGYGERLARAVEVADKAKTKIIVTNIGDGPYKGKKEIRHKCRTRSDFDFRCFTLKPEFDSTRGEASEMSKIAAREGWKTITISTSDYHLFRSKLWFKRCFDGKIHAVSAPPAKAPYLRKILHEYLAIVHFFIINNRCYADPDMVD